MFKTLAVIFYPILIVIILPIFIYAQNPNEGIPISFLIALVSILIVSTAFVLLILRFLVNDSAKASAIVSIIAVPFFSYGFVRHFALYKNLHYNHDVVTTLYRVLLVVEVLFVFAIVIFVIKYRGNLAPLAWAIGAPALFIVLFNTGQIVVDSVSASNLRNTDLDENYLTLTELNAPTLPDIYYIIMDGYGRADVLNDTYGFDNNPFIEFLTQKGFFVASESRANYMVTVHSIPSSLKMDYLAESERLDPAFENTAVLKLARQAGYQYIHLNSLWTHTSQNRYANIELNSHSRTEVFINDYSLAVLHATPMHRILRFVRSIATLDNIDNISPTVIFENGKRDLFKGNMNQLKEIANNPAQTFVFNHNYTPHPPHIFDQNGNEPQGVQYLGGDESGWHAKTMYVDEIIYINTWIEDVVSSILEQSNIEPIIIIQGDHGPASNMPIPNTFKNATGELILERTAILNAIYLPEDCRTGLYPGLSPVNTFRIVFNCLGGEIPLLDDVSYWGDGFWEIESSPIDFPALTIPK